MTIPYIGHPDFFGEGLVKIMKIDIEDIQDHEDPYWTQNLKGMLGMTDQIMRLYGDDEETFKQRIAEFMWRVVQKNLPLDTKARHEDEFERVGTFPKLAGKPGISHLIAEAYPRDTTQTKWWRQHRPNKDYLQTCYLRKLPISSYQVIFLTDQENR